MEATDWSWQLHYTPHLPSLNDTNVCRKLWNDGFVVMTRPFILAVLPLVTLIISLLFILFLLIILRRYLRRQRESPSPSRKMYLILVWVLAVVNLCRSVTNILQDNYSWTHLVIVIAEAISSSIVLAVEVSVVIFVLHAHMQVWTELLKRVLIITGVLFGLYAVGQIPLIYFNREWITKWGYYALPNYWIAVNSVWALIYIILLTLKIINCQVIRMPKRAIFTVYMACMLALHLLFVANFVGIYYFSVLWMYCTSAVLQLVHFVLIGPLLYYAFLWDFVFPRKRESPFSELYNQLTDEDPYEGSINHSDLSPQSQWLLKAQNRASEIWPHD